MSTDTLTNDQLISDINSKTTTTKDDAIAFEKPVHGNKKSGRGKNAKKSSLNSTLMSEGSETSKSLEGQTQIFA